MIVKLTNDTVVRFRKGSVIEVDEAEAKRLVAFNNAVIEEPKEPKKKTKKAAK